ncbi:MAG: hypothetical protein HY074_17230 [Deltaproteobacteria bacterium]|nr:hypothetical protein [Deltaproteobacteria bacterium]
MKFASMVFISMALLAGAAVAAQPSNLYSVAFKTQTSSCTGKDYLDAYNLHFGERDKSGRCLDNTSLNCMKRFTLSLGTAFGPELLASGPSICTSSGKNCVEVQFSFVRDPKSPQNGDEYVRLATYGHRGGGTIKGESALVPVAKALEASRRYVISLDACHYTYVDFKLSPR